MFGTSFRRIRVIPAALVLALLAFPGVASAAAPTIAEVEVFGNERPEDPNIKANMGPETLFANSRPFGTRYEHGLAHVRGRASGTVDGDGILRLFVDIVATDGVSSISRTVTVQPVDDPEFGAVQGDFSAQLEITELGQHHANGDDPLSGDPTDWGGSDIEFFITARNLANEVSATETRILTKYAGTPGDRTPPQLTGIQWPPTHWCHLSGQGAQMGSGGPNMGGNRDGNCGEFSQEPFGAIPDVTWVLCVNLFPGFDYQRQVIPSQMRSQMCRTTPEASVPTGHARVKGFANDMPVSAQGIASEIKSVVIDVLFGDELYDTRTHIRRHGHLASWDIAWPIQDLEPNAYPQFANPPYRFRVTACDAWDHCSTATSGNIWVYPY